jgi:hypothetical protein
VVVWAWRAWGQTTEGCLFPGGGLVSAVLRSVGLCGKPRVSSQPSLGRQHADCDPFVLQKRVLRRSLPPRP